MAHTRSHRRRQSQTLAAAFAFPFDVSRFIDQAIRQFPENPMAFAYALILNSREFRQRFPGIRRADGTLRISVSEFLQREEQFVSTAAQFGFGLSRAQVGMLVSRGRDPQEFVVLATGIQQARTNPGLRDFLNQQIQAVNVQRRRAGRQTISTLRSQGDVIDFFAGRADALVYRVYEGALFQASAQGSGLELSQQRAAQLALQTPGVISPDEAAERFSRIAGQLDSAGPEIRSFVLNRLRQVGRPIPAQRALEIIEFGGPGREELANLVEKALAQRQAQVETTTRSPQTAGTPGQGLLQGQTQAGL